MKEMAQIVAMIIITFVPYISTQLPFIKKDEFFGNSSLVKILDQFRNYQPVIHYDHTTSKYMDFIFYREIFKNDLYLINYDFVISVTIPKGPKRLQIVILTAPELIQQFSNIDYNIRNKDIVLFVIMDDLENTLTRICKFEGLHRAGVVFIFGLVDEILSYCCYYCRKNVPIVKRINSVKKDVPELKKFVNNFKDLGGHIFKVGYGNQHPYFYCSQNSGEDNCVSEGVESNLIKLLSKLFNFKYELKIAVTESNSLWQQLINDVNSRKLDWAISAIGENLQWNSLVDYSRYFRLERFTFLFYVKDDFISTVSNFFLSMKISYWMILVCMASSVISIALLITFNPRLFHEINIVHETERDRLMISLKLLFGQSYPVLLHKISAWKTCFKILISFWWLLCYGLSTYYKCVLSSMMLKMPDEFNSLNEIVDEGYSFRASLNDLKYFNKTCSIFQSAVCSGMMKKIQSWTNLCDSVLLSMKDKVAVVATESLLQQAVVQCKFLTPEQISNLRLVNGKLLGGAANAWAMQKSTPFVDAFSVIISRLQAAGITQQWFKQQRNYFQEIPANNEATLQMVVTALNIWHLLFPFILLVVGLTCSFFIFLVERKVKDKKCFKIF